MLLLHDTGLDEVIRDSVHNKPFLGICLGLQTLLARSEESDGTDGFCLIDGTVRRFSEPLYDSECNERLKIPHMGWNTVRHVREHPLWSGIPDEARFYFVHSYYADPTDRGTIAGITPYAFEFASALAFDTVFAVQFHPEKSQQAGLKLLENFLAW
jgi:glutamine amidotransferase